MPTRLRVTILSAQLVCQAAKAVTSAQLLLALAPGKHRRVLRLLKLDMDTLKLELSLERVFR